MPMARLRAGSVPLRVPGDARAGLGRWNPDFRAVNTLPGERKFDAIFNFRECRFGTPDDIIHCPVVGRGVHVGAPAGTQWRIRCPAFSSTSATTTSSTETKTALTCQTLKRRIWKRIGVLWTF